MQAAQQIDLKTMSRSEKLVLLETLLEKQRRNNTLKAQNSFLGFIEVMWDGFISGRHHKIIAEKFKAIAEGKTKRLIINMPPRHTKSEFASHYLPAWFLGLNPTKKIIQTSHTAELAVNFGRKVRNLVGGEKYLDIFGDVGLSADSKAAGRWETKKGGEYFAIGVGGALAGRGADILIIDDPHTEQEAISAESNPEIYDSVYEWYMTGPRQRLQPGGAIVIVMTRWSKRDLTGRLLADMVKRDDSDQWEVVEFPALFEKPDAHNYKNEADRYNSLWPEFWPVEELLKLKNSLPVSRWSTQYQQQPISDAAAIIKKEWWKLWNGENYGFDKDEPPPCEYLIMSWDTAFTKTTRSDFSACTVWGIFYMVGNRVVKLEDVDRLEKINVVKGMFTRNNNNVSQKPVAHIILLNAFKGRYEFPELKKVAYDEYMEWRPDSFLIEAKAAGQPLVFELRSMGIAVQDVSVNRGSRTSPNDKVARVNGVADLFSSGFVWCPDTRWAEEVMEEFAGFPGGAEHDDLVDSSVIALMRFRQGGFVRLDSDNKEEYSRYRRRRAKYY